MYAEMPANVLIEPSLLVDERTLYRVIENLHQYRFEKKEYEFFVPSKFIYLLSDAERNIKNILFFANPPRIIDIKELREILAKEKVIQKFEIQPHYRQKYSIFYERLLEETKNDVITEILFEEWVFLQEKSWVISRIKKPFSHFVKAGAVSVEFGRRTLDLAIKRTLKKDDRDIITNADRLRAFAKWIAVGGPAFLTLINPVIGAIGDVIAGYFLLVDPRDEKLYRVESMRYQSMFSLV